MSRTIDQIKERLDIVTLVSETVQLRRAGRTFVGFCPFHSNTRTPAFTVFPDSQSFHCFGCKANGTIFDFVMRRDALEFTEALQLLAHQTGVELKPRTEKDDQEDARRARLAELLSAATRFWTHVLLRSPKGAAAREYLEGRGIGAETIEQFQLGFAPDEWSATMAYLNDRLSATPDEMQAAGLILEREHGGYYDRFRSRVMFPIHDGKGRVVGFGGRTLGDAHPKYLNSPQSEVFDKSALLYGLYQGRDAIRSSDHVVVVEGYIDVIMAHQHGFANVVAPMGTALTDTHATLINKLTHRITLAMDGDAAGRTAVLRGLETLRDNLDTHLVPVPSASGMLRWERELDATIKIAVLPPGRDPDDIIREHPAAWSSLLENAQPLMDFYLTSLLAGLNFSLAKDKATAVERMTPFLNQISDVVERDHYLQKLSALSSVPERIIREALQPARATRRNESRTPAPPTPRAMLSAQEQETQREDFLLALLLTYPHTRSIVEEQLRDDLAASPVLRELWSGDVTELLERTENRVLWEQWRTAGPDGPLDPPRWAETLNSELYDHYTYLLQRINQSMLRPYKVTHEVQECLRPLRRRLAQRWNERVGHLIDAAAPDEHERLLEQAMALLGYLRASSEPRRSTYFQDTRDSLKF